MIHAAGHLVAIYTDGTTRCVQAWSDDDSEALVSSRGGRLKAARALDGFVGIVEASTPAVPALPGTIAMFANEHRRDVIAWDDQGRALVDDAAQRRLVPASSVDTFRYIEEPGRPVVAVAPGEGWKAWVQPRDGDAEEYQVVCWVMYSNRFMVPYVQWGSQAQPLSHVMAERPGRWAINRKGEPPGALYEYRGNEDPDAGPPAS